MNIRLPVAVRDSRTSVVKFPLPHNLQQMVIKLQLSTRSSSRFNWVKQQKISGGFIQLFPAYVSFFLVRFPDALDWRVMNKPNNSTTAVENASADREHLRTLILQFLCATRAVQEKTPFLCNQNSGLTLLGKTNL